MRETQSLIDLSTGVVVVVVSAPSIAIVYECRPQLGHRRRRRRHCCHWQWQSSTLNEAKGSTRRVVVVLIGFSPPLPLPLSLPTPKTGDCCLFSPFVSSSSSLLCVCVCGEARRHV